MAKRSSKQDAMNAANAKLLEQLCGQGDFLYSKRRSLVVRETMGCIATCPGCQKLHAEGREKKVKDLFEDVKHVDHHYHEDCGAMGWLIHAFANQQHLLSETFYFKAADALWDILSAAKEVPSGLEGEALKEEKVIRLCEFVALIGATAGIRAYHRSTGQTLPEAPHTDLPPRFQRLREICDGLQWDPEFAWGATVKDMKPEIYSKLGLELTPFVKGMHDARNPNSKWEPALTTAYAWFHWTLVAYPPNGAIMQVKQFECSKLSRADMETVAAAYTTQINCAF